MSGKKQKTVAKTTKLAAPTHEGDLLNDLRILIEQAREKVAQQINSELVLLYWSIGQRINTDILQQERAENGKQVLETLSAQLSSEYGRGFSRSNLSDMVRFAETFPDRQIIQTLSGKLGWSHMLCFEPAETRNTGNVEDDYYTAPNAVRI